MSAQLETLWYTRCSIPTGFGLAMQNGALPGRFSAQGTTIRSLKESPDPAVRESHFDHTLENSVRYGGSSPAIWARACGRQTRLLGVTVSGGSQLLVTTPHSGITRVAELKGRRFGVPLWLNQQIDFLRAHALRGLENALNQEGLSVADVERVDYPVQARFSDDPVHRIPGTQTFGPRRLPGMNAEILGLIRGEVDAIYLHGARGLQLANDLQLQVIADLGQHPDPLIRANNASPATLTVDAGLVQGHPATATALLEEVLRAERWAAAHPDALRQAVAREVNASEFWAWKSYGGEAGLALQTTLDEGPLAALQHFADFLHRWKFVPARVDVRQWTDAAPLTAARHAQAPIASAA